MTLRRARAQGEIEGLGASRQVEGLERTFRELNDICNRFPTPENMLNANHAKLSLDGISFLYLQRQLVDKPVSSKRLSM